MDDISDSPIFGAYVPAYGFNLHAFPLVLLLLTIELVYSVCMERLPIQYLDVLGVRWSRYMASLSL